LALDENLDEAGKKICSIAAKLFNHLGIFDNHMRLTATI
jgi:hypothetical protein